MQIRLLERMHKTRMRAAEQPHELMELVADVLKTIHRGAARFVKVSEDEMAEAMRNYYDDTHQVAEGAGAAPLAVLLQERGRMANKNVGVNLSDGNMERARFSAVLAGRTPGLS